MNEMLKPTGLATIEQRMKKLEADISDLFDLMKDLERLLKANIAKDVLEARKASPIGRFD